MLTVGCGRPTTEQVGPVQLDVPADWVIDDRLEAAGDLLEERRWHPDATDRARTLQVVVGCGDGGAEQLRAAFGEAYQVHDELLTTSMEVPGLDEAERVSLSLTADPLGEAAGGFRIDGLYGAGSGGLVVVELGAAEDEHDAGVADQLLGSVEVDAETLASRCADVD